MVGSGRGTPVAGVPDEGRDGAVAAAVRGRVSEDGRPPRAAGPGRSPPVDGRGGGRAGSRGSGASAGRGGAWRGGRTGGSGDGLAHGLFEFVQRASRPVAVASPMRRRGRSRRRAPARSARPRGCPAPPPRRAAPREVGVRVVDGVCRLGAAEAEVRGLHARWTPSTCCIARCNRCCAAVMRRPARRTPALRRLGPTVGGGTDGRARRTPRRIDGGPEPLVVVVKERLSGRRPGRRPARLSGSEHALHPLADAAVGRGIQRGPDVPRTG